MALISLPQAGPSPAVTQTTPNNAPQAYREAEGLSADHASQGNGLTASRRVALPGKVRILDANQAFFDHWRGVADKSPVVESPPGNVGAMMSLMGLQTPPRHYAKTQIESEGVRVLQPSDQNLLRTDEQGRLSGDPQLISTFVTADSVHRSNSEYLGRPIRYRSPDGKLSLYTGSPGVADAHYRSGTGSIVFSKDLSVGDPDVVAHEQGHALMNAERPNITSRDRRTVAAEEGFADSLSMIHSLRDADVRADLLARWEKGQGSSLATTIGESTHRTFAELAREPRPDARAGIRDLAADPPRTDDPKDDGHEASRRYSHAVASSLRDVYQELRKSQPELSKDDALVRARDIVGSDLTRSLDFMHNGNATSQEEMAEAFLKAGRVDRQGSYQEVYRRNFEAAGVEVSGNGVGRSDRELAGLAGDPALRLPQTVREGGDYERVFPPPVDTGRKDQFGFPVLERPEPRQTEASTALAEYLKAHGEALGIPQGIHVHRIAHNDRGETQVLASRLPMQGVGVQMLPPEVSANAALVFDRDGRLIHLDSRQFEARPQPNPLEHLRPGTPPQGR